MGKGVFQDDAGNESSFRKVFIPLMRIVSAILIVVLFVFIRESYKEVPDYQGVASVAGVFFGGGVITLLSKALQKKYENLKY